MKKIKIVWKRFLLWIGAAARDGKPIAPQPARNYEPGKACAATPRFLLYCMHQAGRGKSFG